MNSFSCETFFSLISFSGDHSPNLDLLKSRFFFSSKIGELQGQLKLDYTTIQVQMIQNLINKLVLFRLTEARKRKKRVQTHLYTVYVYNIRRITGTFLPTWNRVSFHKIIYMFGSIMSLPIILRIKEFFVPQRINLPNCFPSTKREKKKTFSR